MNNNFQQAKLDLDSQKLEQLTNRLIGKNPSDSNMSTSSSSTNNQHSNMATPPTNRNVVMATNSNEDSVPDMQAFGDKSNPVRSKKGNGLTPGQRKRKPSKTADHPQHLDAKKNQIAHSILNYEGFNKTESPGKINKINPADVPANKFKYQKKDDTPTKFSAGNAKGNYPKARKQLMQAQQSNAPAKVWQNQSTQTPKTEQDGYGYNISQNAFNSLKKGYEEMSLQNKTAKEFIKKLLIDKAEKEKHEIRKNSLQRCVDLGRFSSRGYGSQDRWENGQLFDNIDKKRKLNVIEKQDIENQKKNLQKTKSSTKRKNNNDDSRSKFDFVVDRTQQKELHEQFEILKLREVKLKEEADKLNQEWNSLERERSLHIRELKRIRNEDTSKFNDHKVLHDRYLLLNMLGKGGFSEVYKGYDLTGNRYVAVKIHHLNREWNDQKKQDYAKHANRESEIHRMVDHPRIVSLYDRFEVDINTFCTVLEYCDGNDLDFYLKEKKMIPEREAKTIILQVVSALQYLSKMDKPVIHYDLKPGNILMSKGKQLTEIKITDFGLSKIKDNSSPGDMELTSQGAGTYWYLPPECFCQGPMGGPPKISNKVDVWSVGVIFFQCLWGRKPFGNGQTQEAILQNGTIINARTVEWPQMSHIKVTNEAKSFIQRCLCYNQENRADVNELYEHPYLQAKVRAQPKSSSLSQENRNNNNSDLAHPNNNQQQGGMLFK